MKVIKCLLFLLLISSCQIEEEFDTGYKDRALEGVLNEDDWSFVSGFSSNGSDSGIVFLWLYDCENNPGTDVFDTRSYTNKSQELGFELPLDAIVGKHEVSSSENTVTGYTWGGKSNSILSAGWIEITTFDQENNILKGKINSWLDKYPEYSYVSGYFEVPISPK